MTNSNRIAVFRPIVFFCLSFDLFFSRVHVSFWFHCYFCNVFARLYFIICKWSVLYLFCFVSFFFCSSFCWFCGAVFNFWRLFTFYVLFAFLADRFMRPDQLKPGKMRRNKLFNFFPHSIFIYFDNFFSLLVLFCAAPPEITVERSWVHAVCNIVVVVQFGFFCVCSMWIFSFGCRAKVMTLNWPVLYMEMLLPM